MRPFAFKIHVIISHVERITSLIEPLQLSITSVFIVILGLTFDTSKLQKESS